MVQERPSPALKTHKTQTESVACVTLLGYHRPVNFIPIIKTKNATPTRSVTLVSESTIVIVYIFVSLRYCYLCVLLLHL